MSAKVRARWKRRGTNERGTSCGVVRLLRATSVRSIAFRLGTPARVTLTVRKGRKVVHRVAARSAAAGRLVRVRVPARKVRRGRFTVTLRAVPRTGKPATLKVTARARR